MRAQNAWRGYGNSTLTINHFPIFPLSFDASMADASMADASMADASMADASMASLRPEFVLLSTLS